ncbi:MAG: hypothetical protein CMC55_06030 [Flavobacteriaceae bacterium]|jgi:hypothetical protein|nr:hypothetical protein [Flavobacteriaceae bacterium]
MAQPDKSKKVVSQTGYDNSNVAPFTDNYRELYRETLEENGILRERIERYALVIEELYQTIKEESEDSE